MEKKSFLLNAVVTGLLSGLVLAKNPAAQTMRSDSSVTVEQACGGIAAACGGIAQ